MNDTTTYYYRLKAVDNAGSQSAASTTVSIKPYGKYQSAPTVSSAPTVTLKPTVATISWTTDRISTSFVKYSKNKDNLNESTGSDLLTQTHQVVVTGLTPGTLYYYQVQSFDANRDYTLDSALSTQYTFTTPDLPSISNVQVQNIGLYSADISWETTTVSTSSLNYGRTTGYGNSVEDVSGTDSTSHSTKLTSLDSGTNYHFKITGTDIEQNELESDDYSFTTLPLPEISDFSVKSVAGRATSTIKVSWTTNVDATTTVLYSSPSERQKENSSSKLIRTHEVEIADLSDNSVYAIYALSRDSSGNEARSKPINFTTPNDTRAPQVLDIVVETSNVGTNQENTAQAAISFKTDEPASARIEYGEGSAGAMTDMTGTDDAFKTEHLSVVTGLKPLTQYHFKITVSDKSGNKGMSPEKSFVTNQVRKGVLDLILQILQKVFGWIKL